MKSDENLMKLPFHQIFIRFHQISSDFIFFIFFIFFNFHDFYPISAISVKISFLKQ